MTRGEPDRGLHVIAKDQEPGAIRANLGKCHAVENGAHRMFADAEVEIPPAIILGGEISGLIEREAGFG